MFRNKSVDVSRFVQVPRADIPRSTFKQQWAHKTTFDAGFLIPIYIDEVIPGDHFKVKMTAFARLATPIFPIMDNLHFDTHFFFVPNRLIWNNWVKFMGEQTNPGDSISYLVPQSTSPLGGYPIGSLQDYMGLGTVGQVIAGNAFDHNTLHLRAYNLIWNEWFRDENLQNSVVVDKGDGPDTTSNYTLLRRGKRKDYFTSALPFPQKGQSILLPLGSQAPIRTSATEVVSASTVSMKYKFASGSTGYPTVNVGIGGAATSGAAFAFSSPAPGSSSGEMYPSNLYADLSSATSATITQLRQSFQIQKLLERDSRSGTRYSELLQGHFAIRPQDSRLQRPEYLGGGSTMINVNPVTQTSATGTYANTPLGTLSAYSQLTAHHGFSASFPEHGVIIGLASVRADLTYQQGLNRMHFRRTRFDFYWPVFSHLGEQTVLNKEIYLAGDGGDEAVYGYQERWAEYRYYPSYITGLFRSTAAGTLDAWHLAQRFTGVPTLNSTFIEENPPLDRILAVPTSSQVADQIIFDSFFSALKTRPMPMFSVPGLIDHF